MNRRACLRLGVRFSSWLGLSLVACGSAPKQQNSFSTSTGTMKLESTAFIHNELIPSRYTCDGEDISPPLNWNDPPAATKSLALICDDPDAPMKTWVHWVVYNLPPETRSLPEKIPAGNSLSNGGLQGKNDFGKIAYGGPCPPRGTHRYFFKLYALDTMLDLKPGATKAQLEAAMKGHILAQAEFIGHYRRK
ncbi:Raf kinase inhibitor-like protein, YbhB/YbcL family [Pleurocapsa sp. PCC 7327]|uniref:YbhB/YbcL family Raf kinase inhibitor-like protein n=1 Tax=Pleurocapsa sp. PCC 7327 TaxID=118163 RepID=UPI00029FF2B8|nr:YbhB/YbcL family Raf kinase inhibitor-like protein [Pleurocapsa sp. PCC 7327]AFY78371.1 Raf kinase inhibitor-like protein, YbhB/YbcL family [Pleurocapsa sp. PCC 7327]